MGNRNYMRSAGYRYARPGDVNYEPVDRWTFGHMAVGAIAGVSGVSPLTTLVSVTAWEIAEHPLRNSFPKVFGNPKQDSLINSVFDIGAAMFGWKLGSATIPKKT